jgi:luciferase family oxidoreductase group 1
MREKIGVHGRDEIAEDLSIGARETVRSMMGAAIRLGILDLDEPASTLVIAPLAERLGYSRYWLAEHHGEGSRCASPEIMTALVAGLTDRIRVGPAGVILNFKSPLSVTEDFRLLSSLFPGRIDLGLARGVAQPAVVEALLDGRPRIPTSDEHASRAADVAALLTSGVWAPHPLAGISVPPPGEIVPPQIWILGSSDDSARIAAHLGLAFCVPEHLTAAESSPAVVQRYRDDFRPGAGFREPTWSVCTAGVCADTQAAAARTLSSLPAFMRSFFRATWVGSPTHCRDRILEVAYRYQATEVIVYNLCVSVPARRRAYERLADGVGLRSRRLGATASTPPR